MTQARSIAITENEFHALFKMQDIINQFVHQPENFATPDLVSDFFERQHENIKVILAALDRILARQSVENSFTEVIEPRLIELRATLVVLRSLLQGSSPDLIESFGFLVYRSHIARLYYGAFDADVPRTVREGIAESDKEPAEYLNTT